MSLKFTKLTRLAMRGLTTDQKIIEHGIEFTRLKNGDGRYKINIMVDSKRVHRLVGKESEGVTRNHAEKYIEQVKTDSRAGRLNLPKGRKTVLGFQEATVKYLARLRQEGGNDLKMKAMRINHNLIPFFKNKSLIEISSFDLERFKKRRLDGGVKKATVNRDLAVVSHIFNKGIEWGWLEHAPCKIKLFKEGVGRIVYLTTDQIARLMESAKESFHPFVHAFIMVGIHTSMRRMEILSIEIANINLDQKTIFIPEAKGGSRLQPITAELTKFLRKYVANCLPDQQWLFPSKRSKRGHTVAIEKPFREVVKGAGLDPSQIVRHTLRHTAITHLVQDGVDLITVKRISGHKSLEMVERYSHQSGAHISAAMDRLEVRVSVGKKSG